MSETYLKAIKAVHATESSTTNRLTSGERTNVSGSVAPKSTRVNDTQKEMHLSNISIHFNVDEETNRLVVVVSERDSGRLIRTIPASEFEKMQAGDLLKLKA